MEAKAVGHQILDFYKAQREGRAKPVPFPARQAKPAPSARLPATRPASDTAVTVPGEPSPLSQRGGADLPSKGGKGGR